MVLGVHPHTSFPDYERIPSSHNAKMRAKRHRMHQKHAMIRGVLPAANELRVEGLDPHAYAEGWQTGMVLAVDRPHPILSWTIPTPPREMRGATPDACRVVMRVSPFHEINQAFNVSSAGPKQSSDTGNETDTNTHPAAHELLLNSNWDSGVLTSIDSSVMYDGPTLDAGARYCFAVWWRDQVSQTWSHPSELACFEMGLPNSLWDLLSEWIGDDQFNLVRSPEFHLSATTLLTAVAARLYVSGLGFAQVYVNGHHVSHNESLGVGWTRYDKRALYVVYSVLPTLRSGKNVIGAMLGAGWRDHYAFPSKNTPAGDDKEDVSSAGYTARVIRAVLRIQLSNGQWINIKKAATSPSWSGAPGPVSFDSIFDGETFDERLELQNWSEPGNTDDKWTPLPNVQTQVWARHSIMSAQGVPPIRELAVHSPVSISQVGLGHFIIDFGENLAGVCRVANIPDADPGTILTLRHAEVKMHPPYGIFGVNGTYLYYDNLRKALATDRFVYGMPNPDKHTHRVWQPTFTYHGFRYAELTGWPCAVGEPCRAPDIVRVQLGSAVEQTGSVVTSNPTLNAISKMALGSQQANLMSVPTDCPQRDERLGWMGDVGLSATSMFLHFDMAAFVDAYLDSISDEENPRDGSLPDVVPFYRYGERPGDPSWTAAFPTLLWNRYSFDGDLTPYLRHRSSLRRYLRGLSTAVRDAGGLSNMTQWGHYGDWVPAAPESKPSITFTSAASWISSLGQALELATAVGGPTANAETHEYKKTREEATRAFLDVFYDSSVHVFGNGGQTAGALGLELGILSPREQHAAFKEFQERITASPRLQVGIIGARVLLSALVKGGRADLAMRLMTQEQFPSFGFMTSPSNAEPATSNMWELWDAPTQGPDMNSRNHHMFSSVGAFVFDAAGLVGASGNHHPLVTRFRPLRLRVGGCCGELHRACFRTKLMRARVSFCWNQTAVPIGANATLTHVSVSVGAAIKRTEISVPLLNRDSSALRIRERQGLLFAGNIYTSTKVINITSVVGVEPVASVVVDESTPARLIKLFMGAGSYEFSVFEHGTRGWHTP